ncbi:MAG TPA: GNAT family N-acetyltransferase [Kribbella sp.]|nr:GNAT family N-acetyltransferase [Kribbella sp.]
MTIEIGRFDGDWTTLTELINLAFGTPWSEAQLEAERRVWESDRSLVAVDGKELAGHTGAFSLLMAVPGAQLPVAGVTLVGVLPTHRRRGILRDLMRQQLTELYESDAEPVAALTASEPSIYGRFGYGLASDHLDITIPRTSRSLRPVAGTDEVGIRYADTVGSLELCTTIHDAEAATRAAMFRHDARWRQYVSGENVTSSTANASPLRCVLAERSAETTGYAHFRTRRSGKNTIDVIRVHATDLASHVALWTFLLDQDLMAQTTYERLPSDDPLLALLVDPRVAQPTIADGLWARLVDVPRALAARTYEEEVDVVLGVRDDFCPWNAGAWRLAGGPAGATCERTDEEPDVVLDVRELGTVFFGRPSLLRLAAAGLVEEQTHGALAPVSRAFGAVRLPWLDTGF